MGYSPWGRKESDATWHPLTQPWPGLSENASGFWPLNRMLILGFFVDGLYQVEKVTSIPNLLRVFIMNGCWILSDTFSV